MESCWSKPSAPSLPISEAASLECAVVASGMLGPRYLMVMQQEDDVDGPGKMQGRLAGVIIKMCLVDFLEKLKDGNVDV